MSKKTNTIGIQKIEMLPLEEQLIAVMRGKGTWKKYGKADVYELADELIFTLDFVNGGEPEQPVALNTLPELTGEDGIPAIELVKMFGLDDYIDPNVSGIK